MRRPIKTRKDLDISSNHFLRRNPGYPLGVTLTELDYLRGWKDDFLGDFLADQYSTVVTGAGAAALVGGAHGGIYGVSANAGIGNAVHLWLGDAVDGHTTLDADEGWVQLIYWWGDYALCGAQFGVTDAAYNNFILCGAENAANWVVRTRTGGGGISTGDSGIAADGSPHWMACVASTGRVDLFIDGSLAVTAIANVPVAVLTPLVFVYNYSAIAAKTRYIDYWAVIPR